MKILSTGLMLTALIGLAACNPNGMHPTDTGNMQTPVPMNTGTLTAPPMGRDVGNMQAPSGSGGVVSRTMPMSAPADTGNMALPPAAQGNSLPHP